MVSKICITFANEIRNDRSSLKTYRCNSVGRMLHLGCSCRWFEPSHLYNKFWVFKDFLRQKIWSIQKFVLPLHLETKDKEFWIIRMNVSSFKEFFDMLDKYIKGIVKFVNDIVARDGKFQYWIPMGILNWQLEDLVVANT